MPTISPFAAAGALRPLYEAVDWGAHPLGPPDSWPTELVGALRTGFGTKFPYLVCWGQDLVMLYNEAYAGLIADKHPGALGCRVADVFPEEWDNLNPLFERTFRGESLWLEDMRLLLHRRGGVDEGFFTFSYSPLWSEDGQRILGVLDIAKETTRRQLDRRRLELLARLGDLVTDLDAGAALRQRAEAILASAPEDLPEVEVRLPTDPLPRRLPTPDRTPQARNVHLAEVRGKRYAWTAIPGGGGTSGQGSLTVRLSELLEVDEAYLDFIRLVATSIGDAASVVAAHDAERRRAENQARHAARLRALVDVAQTLPDVPDEEEVHAVVAEQARVLLQARHVAFEVVDPDDVAGPSRVLGDLGGHLADRTVLPMASALRGDAVFLPDVAGHGLAAVPLGTGAAASGAMILVWDDPCAFPPEDADLVRALAAAAGQALERLRARRREQRAAEAVRSLSETLQRSLLTAAPHPDHVQTAVRYLPAAQHAQVGGDWHDAFLSAAGTTCFVIGDVTGHDQEAAAAMGQVRNLLRGIGYSLEVSPATALSALDRAMRDLGVSGLATAVLATLDPLPNHGWRLRWSNAGHPPPLVVLPGGGAELLRTPPDLLLGLDADLPRADHVHLLPPGATVLLYTDGLVERRGDSIDNGLRWLVEACSGLGSAGPDEICDHVLAAVAAHTEDDVALLALRVRDPAEHRDEEAAEAAPVIPQPSRAGVLDRRQ
ncbi:PP2C family protein-serine/threonine phosphatase [Kineococcus gynurae]|uniref:PP2C family protein-serine/threonine phosphatase n=1 Tax=Kineococcus gynurae TaxID=452979 RepID=A0ABV5LT23_9ACTN